eukprot:COSAG01_NODE_3235_length_6375_cov_12.478808_4_plen_38_part_00
MAGQVDLAGRASQAGMPVRRGEVDVMEGAMYLKGMYY